MRQLPTHQQVLLAVQTLALVAITIRILAVRLQRTYPFFFLYLLLDLFQTVILATVPFDSRAYRNAFVVTEGLITGAYALITLELYSVVLKDLTGIARFSKWFIRTILAVAIVVSLLLLGLEMVPHAPTGYLYAIQRPIISSLVFFLLLINAFLVYYPVALPRNAIVYSIGYAVYFLSKATVLFVYNVGHHWNEALSTIRIVVSTACLLFWLFTLSKAGERKSIAIGHWWNKEDEDEVLSRLRAINERLLGGDRKFANSGKI